MNARKKLLDLYRDWHQWTETESAAIRAWDWPRVTECQEAKAALQRLIERSTEAARAESQFLPAHEPSFTDELGRLIENLIARESENSTLLAGQKAALDSERLDIEHSVRNLQRVRQSYTAPPPSGWQSYS